MVIITDCQYRMAISAISYFGKLGRKVVAVTNQNKIPAAFRSKYVSEYYILSDKKEEYIKELYALCCDKRPFILPIGVFTLDILSENRELFEKTADFCVASPDILSIANDKKKMLSLAAKLGLNTPKEYKITDQIDYPVVIKPVCGEKFGLKANERYLIAKNDDELKAAYTKFSAYGTPIIEEYINGYGVGADLLFDKNSNLVCGLCHKRIHEYPINGGPSASCISFYDKPLIDMASKLLKTINFCGSAMVEFKVSNGKYYLLEVNPRIWGSFPLTYHSKSDYCALYERAAKGEIFLSPTFNFKKKVKMKFIASDIMAMLQYIKCKKISKALGVLFEILNPFSREAIFSWSDPKPFIYYILGGKKR